MAAPGPPQGPQGPGRGIHIAGHANFNNRLMSRLSLAPADLMHFLEACAMGNLARVESLLERGVEVNTTGVPDTGDSVLSGTTGLMMAAMSGQTEVVERLIRLPELDINRRGLGQNSALTFAAGQGNTEILLTLLRSGLKICNSSLQSSVSGADPNVTNSSGKTSLGLAADHVEMSDFMDISANLVAAGCVGTTEDWEVLARHPRKKLFVMMEVLRSFNQRISLR